MENGKWENGRKGEREKGEYPKYLVIVCSD
jgi:hypothetical protein